TMLPQAERLVVARALAKKPAERWATCRAFVDALMAAATGQPPGPPTPTLPLPAPVPSTRTAVKPRPRPKPRPVDHASPGRRLGPGIAAMLGILLLALLPLANWLFTARPPTSEKKAANNQRPVKGNIADKRNIDDDKPARQEKGKDDQQK